MFSLRKLNIQNKLMAIIMLATFTAVCLSGGIFIGSSIYTDRESLKNELISLAGVIGNNCKVILEFNFPEDARKVLATLEARHSIVFACIYNADGEILSTYGRRTAGAIVPPPDTQEDRHVFTNGSLHVFHYVRLHKKVIGTIYLQDDMREIKKHIISDGLVLILTMIISLILTYILSLRLQGIISGPILSLADIAGNVSDKKDYSIRANKESEDEVGTLIDSFNDMLVEIEKRDSSLRQSEERFRTLMEQAADAFFLHDTQGRILEVNQCACDSLGYTREELLEMSVLDIEARYVTAEQLKPLWNSLAPKKPLTVEGEHKRKDGKLFPIEVRLGLLETKGEQAVLALVRDITERKLAEEALQETERQIRMLLDSTAEAIYGLDLDGNCTFANPACIRLLGYETTDDLIGKSMHNLIHHSYSDGTPYPVDECRTCQAFKKGEDSHVDDEVLWRADRTNFAAEYWSHPIYKDDQVIGAVVTFLDITDRKQVEENLAQHREHLEELVEDRTTELGVAKDVAEKARQSAETANRAKSEFLANMSHELRTPLNSILGFSQIMGRDPELTPDQNKYLSTITRSGEHLLELINDILEISKIEAEHVMLDETEFDLQQMLDALESMVYLRASAKSLILNFACTPEVPQYIRADSRRLRQILINFLSNAIKFTKQGSVTLRISCQESGVRVQGVDDRVQRTEVRGQTTADRGQRSDDGRQNDTERERPELPDDRRQTTDGSERPQRTTDKGQRTIYFEVEDTGSGIAPEEMAELFEPFSQTRSGRSAQEGTGLGLPISQKFVQLMGGEISVKSIIDQGSIFSFNIPITEVKAADVPQLRQERRVVGLTSSQEAFRILVVDDVEDNRALMLNLLETVGFETREAKNGQEAIQVWEAWEPHLIWMDMAMPVMDGHEATRRIRALEFKIKHSTLKIKRIPIIALTAVAFSEEQEKMLVAGCDDIVHKPLREAEIFEAMHKHLGVRYTYEDEQEGGELPEKKMTADILSPDQLNDIPEDMLAEFEQALIGLNTDIIQSIIKRLLAHNNRLASSMMVLADDFQYDQILTFIQRAIEDRDKRKDK